MPSGFQLLASATSIRIPGGETAEIGLYLIPLDALPAPGTPASFSIRTVSTSNPTVVGVDREDFIIPEVHGVTVSCTPQFFNTSPGSQVLVKFLLTSTGNVAESVSLELQLPEGVTASGLNSPISLVPGETVEFDLTLAAASDAPLGTTLTPRVAAFYGPAEKRLTAVTQFQLLLAVPGTIPVMNASNAATRMGRVELANIFGSLGDALSDLFQNPSDQLSRSRVLALIDSLSVQFDDPLLVAFVAQLNAAKAGIAGANSTSMQAALNNLGLVLTALGAQLAQLADHNFEVSLRPNSAVALPETPTRFGLYLKNTGTQTTTCNLSLSGAPAGVARLSANFGYPAARVVHRTRDERNQCASGPGFSALTQPAHELTAFDFRVTATVEGAPEITRTAHGSFTARSELVEVVSFQANPAFTDPGGQVDVSARLMNAVNQDRKVLLDYAVKDRQGT